MSAIYRYVVRVDDKVHAITLTGPILHVASRARDVVEFWAMAGVEPKRVRYFRVYGTGQPLPKIPIDYIATALIDRFVWHLFEEHPEPRTPGDLVAAGSVGGASGTAA